MKKLQLVVSLPNENSYQLEQAKDARETAAQLGVNVHVVLPTTMLSPKANRFWGSYNPGLRRVRTQFCLSP